MADDWGILTQIHVYPKFAQHSLYLISAFVKFVFFVYSFTGTKDGDLRPSFTQQPRRRLANLPYSEEYNAKHTPTIINGALEFPRKMYFLANR